MSVLKHLKADYRPDEEESGYKEICCMKYTVKHECRRCPFRQILDSEARDRALHECWDKRSGTYHFNGIKIEFNNQYR